MRLMLVLAVLVLAFPLLRIAFVLLFRGGLAGIGRQALARSADRIHLVPASPSTWTRPEEAESLSEPLLENGFEDAGVFTIPELPELVLRLLAKPDEAIMGIVYEHPRAGVWAELATHYQDGTSITYSTAPDHGLDPRPGHDGVHAPGSSALLLYSRFTTERKPDGMKPMDRSTVVAAFESAYAESMAWRKANGVSAVEVARVATRRVA